MLSNARLIRDQANTFVYRFLHPSDIFDFDWQLETSADLVNWLPVAGIDDSSYSDDGFWQKWSIPLSHAGDRQVFYRTRWSSTRSLSADVELVGSFESYGSPSPPVAEVVSAPVRPLPIYGIYCWANEYLRYRDFIRDIGWQHTRLSGPIHDAVVRAYSEDGMSVMYTMATRRPFPQVDGDARNRSDFETDEAFISDYLSGVSEVLERYGPGGTFWEENTDLVHQPIEAIEVYNEPNFWYLNVSQEQHEQNLANPDPERDARLLAERTRVYAQLLPAVYDLVKDQWPSISVVGFATGGAAAADVSFVENVLEANEPVIDAFDIFSTHPYVRPAPPEVDSIRTWGRYSMDSSLRKIRALLDERGRLGTRVWWTELGWSINDGFYPTGPGTRLFDRKVSRELQAAYYVRSYLHALRQGVERLSLMSLVDTDGVNFGLMDRDRTWRPSAHAVATMIALMPHPQLVHVLHDGENGVYVYEIKTNAHEPSSSNVFVAWAVRPQETPISVHWVGQQLAVFDQYAADYRLVDGNPALDTQTLEIVLGPQPIYLKTMEP